MKPKPVAFDVSMGFNDTEMFPRDDTSVPKCARCRHRTELYPHNPDYALTKRFKPIYAPDLAVSAKTTAISATYDGQKIVSFAFRAWCEEQKYQGLEFLEFNKDIAHFHLIVTNEVEEDTTKREMEYVRPCLLCGQAEWIGPPANHLKVNEPLNDGFYRSDLVHGGPYGRSPLIIVGVETRAKIKAAKLKGFSFQALFGLE